MHCTDVFINLTICNLIIGNQLLVKQLFDIQYGSIKETGVVISVLNAVFVFYDWLVSAPLQVPGRPLFIYTNMSSNLFFVLQT